MATEHPKRSHAEQRAREDRRTQRAVLAFLLDQSSGLTRSELIAALDPKDRAEKEIIAGAVRQLVIVGLLDAYGDSVSPSRAALYFDWLESER
jgi:hypothetical protein